MTGLRAEVSDGRADRRRDHIKSRILESPEVDVEDTVSEECDHAPRTYSASACKTAEPNLYVYFDMLT
jgi:hypothetical protein